MELFDSHCHLTAEQFEADRDIVIQRAFEGGVTRILTLATDIATSRAAIALAERYEGIYAAIGIHPESVKDAKPQDIDIIRKLAQHPKVAAIGEIGLDYYWDKTTAALQQDLFEKQLDLAAELNLPVSIHDRDAHDAVMNTLSRHTNTRGVLHAFSGDLEMAQKALELGFVISFGGPITFKNNKHAPDLIRALPLEKLLLETDSPYLTPHPMRGKRNEPSYVNLVAARIAELKGLSEIEVATQTTKNARALFRTL